MRDINGQYLLSIYLLCTRVLCWNFYFFSLKKNIYLFLGRREGWEKRRETNTNMWVPLKRPLPGTCPATQACALTGNQTSDPLVCRLVLNPLSHTSQGVCWKFSTLQYPHEVGIAFTPISQVRKLRLRGIYLPEVTHLEGCRAIINFFKN